MPDSIQPVVLVGGASRRFGRDKLRQPLPDGAWLVDRPIAALRAVFGDQVAAVGECDALVRARFDRVLPDNYPGIGPIGGILSALEHSDGDIFVLAGDLPEVTAATIHRIVESAAREPGACAVVATTGSLEPCIGLYRRTIAAPMREAVKVGKFALHHLLASVPHAAVPIDLADVRNINRPEDLDQRAPGAPCPARPPDPTAKRPGCDSNARPAV